MEYLLNNQLAPVTYSWGFLEQPLDSVSEAYAEWRRQLSARVVEERLESGLKDALLHLDPLSSLPRRCVLLETRSSWTALFDNALDGQGPDSVIGYLCEVLPCRGVFVRSKPQTLNRIHGPTEPSDKSVALTLYASHQTEWLNVQRNISLVNENGKWKFSATGEVQAFERTELYLDRKLKNRFSSRVLKEYCEALGIRLITPGFLWPKGKTVYHGHTDG